MMWGDAFKQAIPRLAPKVKKCDCPQVQESMNLCTYQEAVRHRKNFLARIYSNARKSAFYRNIPGRVVLSKIFEVMKIAAQTAYPSSYNESDWTY